jgi:sigma-B regulation protein RsbU (phosphoserine phosphatase)
MRTLAPLSESPADVVQQINRLFCHNIHFTTFVTLFLAAFDPGSRTLVYCNAGHNPPLIFHDHNGAGEPVAWLGPTGAAIGLVEEAEFGLEMVRLSPGDVLLLYTDGVTETINRRQELFGQARLAELVREASDSSARDLVRTLRQALEEFAEGQQPADDTTIIACKIA